VNKLKDMFPNTEENVVREALNRANDCVETAILALWMKMVGYLPFLYSILANTLNLSSQAINTVTHTW
jgi:hypothetical protein